MTKFCTRCGTENEDSAAFCKACGAPLSSAPQSSSPPSVQQTYSYDQNTVLYSNLKSLRSAFFWMFLGSILTIIPFVSIVGAIILFIGYILLIMGFGKVSKTTLAHAAEYGSTGKWLLFLMIYGIVFVIASIFFLLLASFLITSVSTTTGTITKLHMLSLGLAGIIALIIFGILYLIFFIVTYLKVVGSLKSLGSDLSVQKLHSAGNYMLYSLILTVITYLLMPLFLILGGIVAISSSTGNFSLYSLLAAISVPYIILIIAYVFQILAFHYAYTGIDEFLSKPQLPSSPAQSYPPQQPEPPKFTF